MVRVKVTAPWQSTEAEGVTVSGAPEQVVEHQTAMSITVEKDVLFCHSDAGMIAAYREWNSAEVVAE